jgi:hypothetical protein
MIAQTAYLGDEDLASLYGTVGISIVEYKVPVPAMASVRQGGLVVPAAVSGKQGQIH